MPVGVARCALLPLDWIPRLGISLMLISNFDALAGSIIWRMIVLRWCSVGLFGERTSAGVVVSVRAFLGFSPEAFQLQLLETDAGQVILKSTR